MEHAEDQNTSDLNRRGTYIRSNRRDRRNQQQPPQRACVCVGGTHYVLGPSPVRACSPTRWGGLVGTRAPRRRPQRSTKPWPR